MQALPLLANANGPPWLPAAAAEARKFAYWGQFVLFIFFILGLVIGIASIAVGSFGWGVYWVIAAIVNLLLIFLLNSTVFEPIDQGRFREASDRLLIWGILGLIFSLIPGILLLLAFVRIQEVFQPQYQQYPAQQYPQYQQAPPQYQQPQYQQAPPQYQPPPPPAPQPAPQQPQAPAPAAPAPPPAQPAGEHKAEMTKCKNCGVQYPSFMRNCPNCGAPR